MTTTLAPALTDLIAPHELARAARLALDTLVSILEDAKAKVSERRIAALAILKLAFPARPRADRAPSASPGCATSSTPPQPPLTTPPQRPAPLRDRSPSPPPPYRTRGGHLMATAGAPPTAAAHEAHPPLHRLNG